MTTRTETTRPDVPCPACGGPNVASAVFCAHCDKAMGEFDYVRETLRGRTLWHETLAERATGFIGKPQFIVLHAVWFAVWVMLNTGLVMAVTRWDPYPFSLLGIALSIEAIFMTGFVLISQNRQNAFTAADARLDYEVNVRTYRELVETRALVEETMRRLERLEAAGVGGLVLNAPERENQV